MTLPPQPPQSEATGAGAAPQPPQSEATGAGAAPQPPQSEAGAAPQPPQSATGAAPQPPQSAATGAGAASQPPQLAAGAGAGAQGAGAGAQAGAGRKRAHKRVPGHKRARKPVPGHKRARKRGKHASRGSVPANRHRSASPAASRTSRRHSDQRGPAECQPKTHSTKARTRQRRSPQSDSSNSPKKSSECLVRSEFAHRRGTQNPRVHTAQANRQRTDWVT